MSLQEFLSGKGGRQRERAVPKLQVDKLVLESVKSQKTFHNRFEDDPNDPNSELSKRKVAEKEEEEARMSSLQSKKGFFQGLFTSSDNNISMDKNKTAKSGSGSVDAADHFTTSATSKLSSVVPENQQQQQQRQAEQPKPGQGQSKSDNNIELGNTKGKEDSSKKVGDKKEEDGGSAAEKKRHHEAKFVVVNRISAQSKDTLDHPKYMKNRVLMPGEEVLGEFECFMDVNKWSTTTHMKLLFLTCGIYIIYLLWRGFMNFLYWLAFYDRGTHKLQRCVMQITDKGRLIVMKISMHHKRQGRHFLCFFPRLCFPDLLDTPIEYNNLSHCSVYSLADIKEIAFGFESSGLDARNPYSSQLRISLKKYGKDSPINRDLGISTMSSSSYIYKARQMLGNGRVSIRTDYCLDEDDKNMSNADDLNFDDGTNNNIDSDGITGSCNITIESGSCDSNYGENMKRAVNDVTALYSFITSRLPKMRSAVIPPKDNPYNTVDADDNKSNQAKIIDQIKTTYNSKYSNLKCETRKFYLTTRTNNISIVSRNRNIEVPESWVNMQEGEEICGTYGEYTEEVSGVYEHFLNSVSFGTYLRRKIQQRVAYVLTDRRLIIVCIDGKNGLVPLSNRDCNVDVRSLFFGSIKSGYMISDDPNEHLETGLWTEGGFICLRFSDVKGALPFVRLLHCATSRINHSDVDLRTIYQSKDVLERSKVEEKVSTFYSRPILNNRINNIDLVPLIESEAVVDYFNGLVNSEPFGLATLPLNLINQCIRFANWVLERDYYPKAAHVCSKRQCGVCFPLAPKILSCGVYPVQSLSEIVLTEGTIFHINRAAAIGPSCETGKRYSILNKSATVKLVWMPALSVIGSVTKFETSGVENFFRRVTFLSGLRNICPSLYSLRNSSYENRVLFGDFFFSLSGTTDYYHYDFRKDTEVNYAIGLINGLQYYINEAQIRIENRKTGEHIRGNHWSDVSKGGGGAAGLNSGGYNNSKSSSSSSYSNSNSNNPKSSNNNNSNSSNSNGRSALGYSPYNGGGGSKGGGEGGGGVEEDKYVLSDDDDESDDNSNINEVKRGLITGRGLDNV